jgi:hypothetical protein
MQLNLPAARKTLNQRVAIAAACVILERLTLGAAIWDCRAHPAPNTTTKEANLV